METNDNLIPGDSRIESAGEPPVEEAYDETAEAKPASRLVFPVSGHGLLYDQQTAMEYFEGQAMYRIPNNHPLFRGLINRRGSLVPIFDIRKLIEPQAETGHDNKLLVFGGGDDAVGIVLDDTPYRVSITEDQKSSPPGHLGEVFGPHLVDCFEQSGGYLLDVALDDFLHHVVQETS